MKGLFVNIPHLCDILKINMYSTSELCFIIHIYFLILSYHTLQYFHVTDVFTSTNVYVIVRDTGEMPKFLATY